MKFKDWISAVSEDVIEHCVFKCIGYCRKWFFYADEDVSAKKLKEDILSGWGPADFEIVYIDDVFYDKNENKLFFVFICNDGKNGLTNEQIIEMEKKNQEEMIERFRQRMNEKEGA